MAWHLISEEIGGVLSSALPADTASLAGGAVSTGANVKESGNLWNQTPAGGLAPAGTGSGYVVALATIPANAFNAAGRDIMITAQGNFGANGNTKTISLVVNATNPAVGSVVSGGTTIATTGAVTTNGSAWLIGADIIKTGSLGSNTQSAMHYAAQVGAVVSALQASQSLTLTESAPITIAVVINCATTATDATLWNFQGEWFN